MKQYAEKQHELKVLQSFDMRSAGILYPVKKTNIVPAYLEVHNLQPGPIKDTFMVPMSKAYNNDVILDFNDLLAFREDLTSYDENTKNEFFNSLMKTNYVHYLCVTHDGRGGIMSKTLEKNYLDAFNSCAPRTSPAAWRYIKGSPKGKYIDIEIKGLGFLTIIGLTTQEYMTLKPIINEQYAEYEIQKLMQLVRVSTGRN